MRKKIPTLLFLSSNDSLFTVLAVRIPGTEPRSQSYRTKAWEPLTVPWVEKRNYAPQKPFQNPTAPTDAFVVILREPRCAFRQTSCDSSSRYLPPHHPPLISPPPRLVDPSVPGCAGWFRAGLLGQLRLANRRWGCPSATARGHSAKATRRCGLQSWQLTVDSWRWPRNGPFTEQR